MRIISNDDGTWEMRRISEIEFRMLSKIGEAADPEGSDDAMQRLYPSPLGRPAMDDDEDEFIGDWEGLVRPDLERQFKTAIEVVHDDMRTIKSRKRGGEIEYRLVVPKKHADDWCSALNQARLVLHERFSLPDEEEDFEMDGSPEQWLAMIQSEIYGAIIEFLVRSILWLK